eukprot:3508769-Amphidinium_carterae.1
MTSGAAMHRSLCPSRLNSLELVDPSPWRSLVKMSAERQAPSQHVVVDMSHFANTQRWKRQALVGSESDACSEDSVSELLPSDFLTVCFSSRSCGV